MDGARETRQRRKPRVLFSQVHNPNFLPPIYMILLMKTYSISKILEVLLIVKT